MARRVADQFADVLVAAGVKRNGQGFHLYMMKAVLSGRGDDLIDLAEANLWQ